MNAAPVGMWSQTALDPAGLINIPVSLPRCDNQVHKLHADRGPHSTLSKAETFGGCLTVQRRNDWFRRHTAGVLHGAGTGDAYDGVMTQ
jgi:hypothetical protein